MARQVKDSGGSDFGSAEVLKPLRNQSQYFWGFRELALRLFPYLSSSPISQRWDSRAEQDRVSIQVFVGDKC